MVKVILSYNFDERSHDGRDAIQVKVKNFEYEVKLKKAEYKLTINDLLEKYHTDALEEAAYKLRCKDADIIICGGKYANRKKSIKQKNKELRKKS